MALVNHSDKPYILNPGDRIAQLMFVPVFTARFVETDMLQDTERGTGGFGSTGK